MILLYVAYGYNWNFSNIYMYHVLTVSQHADSNEFIHFSQLQQAK